MTEPDLSGRLLVATPLLGDPNFARRVIMLLQHDGDGAMGVVVNRASEVPVGDVLPTWATLTSEPAVLFHGGPVALDSALGIARVAAPDAEPIGWRRLHGSIGLIDLDTPTELLVGVFAALRIFAGYAGWGQGQLEGEIDEGAWYVVDADDEDPFVHAPAELWRSILRRQGGALALVSTYPDDPALN